MNAPTHSSAVPSRAIGIVRRIASSCSGVENLSWNGVVITPGATALTRICRPASSLARLLVAVLTNPLEPAYRLAPGPQPLRAAILVRLMMLLPLAICGTAYLVHINIERTF